MSTFLFSNHRVMNQVHVLTAPSVGLLLDRVLYDVPDYVFHFFVFEGEKDRNTIMDTHTHIYIDR